MSQARWGVLAVVMVVLMTAMAWAEDWTGGTLTLTWATQPPSLMALDQQYSVSVNPNYDASLPENVERVQSGSISYSYTFAATPDTDETWSGSGASRYLTCHHTGTKTVTVTCTVSGTIEGVGLDGVWDTGDDTEYSISEPEATVTKNVTVVGLTETESGTEMEYSLDSGATWTSIFDEDVISIAKGTEVQFKVSKEPAGASGWPTGKPAWSGTSGVSGTGETKTVTFNTVSTSTTDYKTVIAECGNEVTAKVIVFEVNIKHSDGENDPPEYLSLGGTLQLKAVPSPSGLTGTYAWSESSPKISLTNPTSQTVTINGVAVSASVGDAEVQVAFDPTTQGNTDSAAHSVTVVTTDIDIYSGQNGNLVPETDHDSNGVEDEEDIGAFTVANLNDTNGDTHSDNDDDFRPVTHNGTKGRDEQDLMKLVLRKPAVPGTVKLTVESGDVKIWSDGIKTAEITTLEFPTSNFGEDTAKEWWVEARSATALQGIKLKYEFKPTGSTSYICYDRVSATGIWATCSRVIHNNYTFAEVDDILDADPQYYDATEQGGATAHNALIQIGGTGTSLPYPYIAHNGVVIEFQVSPTNIYSVPELYGDGLTRARPYFDVSRKMEGPSIWWDTGAANPKFRHLPGHDIYPHYPEDIEQDIEMGNDAPAGIYCENDEPTNDGRLWHVDAPGGHDGVLSVSRLNFKAFVRCGIAEDPTDVAYDVSGSRCSGFQEWYSKRTNGQAVAPREIDVGNFTFVQEPLYTEASDYVTDLGVRHYAVNRGLMVAQSGGDTPEYAVTRLVEEDVASDDVIDSYSSDLTAPVEGKYLNDDDTADTIAGDLVAYTSWGYFASRYDGEIVGYSGHGGEQYAEIAHEISGNSSNSHHGDDVVGTQASLQAPDVPTLTLGAITAVTIDNIWAEASDNGGGTQTVKILLVDDDPVDDDILHEKNVTDVPRSLRDEMTGDAVAAIKDALMSSFSTTATIGSKKDGTIIGPSGSSGDTTVEIAYEIEVSGTNPQSASVQRAGPVYDPAAPGISTNPIPVDGTSTVGMNTGANQVYCHATSSADTQDELVNVEIRDADTLSSQLLDQIVSVHVDRPVGVFPGVLIGPASTSGQLTNPDPGGEVKGPDGESDEAEAEVFFRIKDSDGDIDSAQVSVTAQ